MAAAAAAPAQADDLVGFSPRGPGTRRALTVLLAHGIGRPMRSAELAERMEVPVNSMHMRLRSCVAYGLVTFAMADGRSGEWAITPLGEQRLHCIPLPRAAARRARELAAESAGGVRRRRNGGVYAPIPGSVPYRAMQVLATLEPGEWMSGPALSQQINMSCTATGLSAYMGRALALGMVDRRMSAAGNMTEWQLVPRDTSPAEVADDDADDAPDGHPVGVSANWEPMRAPLVRGSLQYLAALPAWAWVELPALAAELGNDARCLAHALQPAVLAGLLCSLPSARDVRVPTYQLQPAARAALLADQPLPVRRVQAVGVAA